MGIRGDEVTWFAGIMERKLRENDDKDGWSQCTTEYLLDRLREEIDELEQCFSEMGKGAIELGGIDMELVYRFCAECADVANFAMMLADNARKNLGPKP